MQEKRAADNILRMPRKKRRSNTVKKSESQKPDVSKSKENNDNLNLENISLPILSEQKIYSEDPNQKNRKFTDMKIPQLFDPKVRLRCLPLNIEKVIDLTTNKIVQEGTITKKRGRKKKNEKISQKTQNNKPITVIRSSRTLRPRCKDEKEFRYLYNSPSSNINVGSCQQKIKIYIKESKFTLKKDSAVSCKNIQEVEVKSGGQIFEGQTKLCLQQIDYLDEEEEKLEVDNFDEAIIDEESDLKVSEDVAIQEVREPEPKDLITHTVALCPQDESCQFALELKEPDDSGTTSLQAAMESFMSNHQLEKEKDIAALKNGLCSIWISNNYICSNRLCPYQHNASKLFTKKLRQHASKHIMKIVVAMKNDVFFVDAVLAAFNILSERKAPGFWLTFLIYFVFYVTEPSDSRFFKFWASSARFFYQMNENSAAARGFASLLSIFSNGDKSEEWKIVEFIKFIKQSPVQIHTTYDLLQPILKLELPSQFLIEAVESCIATEKDVLEVYSMIIPKISVMTSPISVIELLLKFCTTLESVQQKNFAAELKRKLRDKVRTFKIKICQRDYPLTSSFQNEILNSNWETNAADAPNVESDSEIVLRQSNYFQPEGDFYSNVTRALELISDKPFSDLKKGEKTQGNREEEDTSDRQVTRVKQFFTDCHFEVLGKYLNSLMPDVVEETAQEFLKALLQMKITLQQVLDLVKINLLHCQSETAAKINASICVTLIVNLIRINEWDKAHTILVLCEEKRINLLEGKVFYINDVSISQFRVLLLLVEIYMYKENFEIVLAVIKARYLYSSNSCLWKLSWSDNDEAIRIRILEEFLTQTISKQYTNAAYELFMLLWVEQNTLQSPIDLTKFTNEMLILLLNQSLEDGLKFYDKIRGKITLNETATRAVLVTLVGQNRLQEAKNVMLALSQTTYTLPEVTTDGATVTMSSFWLEEEIYVMLDTLFDILLGEMNPAMRSYDCFEVEIQITKPKAAASSIRPLCLGLINSSLEHTCKRIQRVLEFQFKPPIKLIILPYTLVLDKPSLQIYLERRFRRPAATN